AAPPPPPPPPSGRPGGRSRWSLCSLTGHKGSTLWRRARSGGTGGWGCGVGAWGSYGAGMVSSSLGASSSASALPAVGVMLPRDLPHADVLPFARRIEELGFDALWVVEDLGFHGGIAQAAAVLAVTERVRVGIGSLPVAARNVGFAAMDVATLAGMFPGRLDIGLGHGIKGWMSQVGAWPASPLTLLREQTEA